MKAQKRHLIIFFTLLITLIGLSDAAQAGVYWKPQTGNDSNDGSTAAKAVKTWAKAKEKLSSQNNSQWIILCETYRLTANTTMDGAISGKNNARIIRNSGFLGEMIVTTANYTLTLKDITIDGRAFGTSAAAVKSNGAIIGVTDPSTSRVTFTMNSGTYLQNNTSSEFAGAIRLYGSSQSIINGGVIRNCTSDKDGGGIMSGAGVKLTINGGTIQNCAAYGTVEVSVQTGSSTNTNLKPYGRGGGICFWGGGNTLTITGGTITECTAAKYGGGIYGSESMNITMTNNTISSCSADRGGGIAFTRRREATSAAYTSRLTINSGTTISNCSTTGNYGGGVYCHNGADGAYGHVNANSFAFNFNGGKITGCTANSNGGGIGLFGSETGSTFKMNGGEVDGCSASTYGGGIYMQCSTATINLTSGKVHGCTSDRGGGVAINSGKGYMDGNNMLVYSNTGNYYGGGLQVMGAAELELSKGKVYKNYSGSGAAGVHVTGSSTFTMTGGELYENTTPAGGGGLHSSYGCTLNISGGKIYNNRASTQGGGINVNTECNLTFPAGATLEMYGNIAGRGGAINLDGATLSIYDGSFYNNHASDTCVNDLTTKGIGGAFCLVLCHQHTDNGTNLTQPPQFNIYGGSVYGNDATTGGGGIYMAKQNEGITIAIGDGISRINIEGGSINDNAVLNGNGGGAFLEDGIFTMKTGSFDNNSATQYGGGFYVTGNNSIINIEGGSITNNNAVYGGGFAVVGGTCNIKGTGVSIGASGTPNTATYGAGLYAHGGTTNVTKGNIQYNEASQDGGGIYADGGLATVNYAATSDGKIHHNYAGKRGGGLFISTAGRLDLKGKTTLEYNRVPEGELGGGVYLEGTVQAGASSSDIIVVKDNYADNTVGATITSSNRNNIYLPNPTDVLSSGVAKDVITVVNNGLNLGSSKIGFSVPHNFVPVIYCATTSYLSPTIMNSDAIFEDSERYTKYYSTTAPYKANYIYLSADTWFAAVGTQPSGFSYDNIDSPEDLAWLISVVNGRTSPSVTASSLSGVTVRLTADIDMKAHTWVPIGYTGKSFNGTFDGNGHTISNVFCNYLGEGEGGTGRGLGLFGTVENATIHDVFVNGVELEVKNQTGSDAYSMGAIANEAKGTTTIYNCTAASKMESTMTNTTMGGLVGKLTAGTIHSSAAMPDMTGYTMGGLAGTTAGTIYNSFANPKFKYSGAASACFVGGLAASNSGTIQNCYVRFSRPSTFGNAAKFGQIVGQNQNTGSATICYHPTTYASGIPSALVNSGTVSSTIYGDVVAPYLYYHGNNNLVGSTGVTLCDKLNEWVGSHSGHSTWKRTTAGAYSAGAGNINGDYPIHRHESYTCAASTNNGVNLDYAASLDAILARHTSNATVNLYAADRTVSSTGSGVVVYIDENVSLLQDVGSGTPASSIEAYTCQTLPGDPRSWHFLSSSLEDSGIGFSYSHDADFNWDPDPCGLTFSSDDDQALYPSDMPAVNSMDLYCFYEPEYHWINFKRNSNSHWHMNATTVAIDYANEPSLTPGKGYLVSIDQDQLLQNRGTLNNGTVTVGLGYTPANTWAGLLGYNLLGNPYQSYLDFSAFASANSSLWYDGRESVEPTYAVYDASMGGYVQYKEGASRGAKAARGVINMHQGFMVKSRGATSATFTNAMRTNDGTTTGIRGEQPAYPLVNLTVTDDEGVNDFAVLELGRDADEGAEKLRANDSKGWLYLHHGNENYGILFRTEVDDYQPLWFEAEEAGTYTLSWETANGEFDQLTLIDNITGEVTDMLTHDSYVFEGNPEQYKSRFKIVVGEWKDIDENIDGPSTSSGTFAYYTNGEIHLAETFPETSQIQIVDMLGRVIVTRIGRIQCVPTNGMVPGVYILRLITSNGTRTQKIVLN